MTRKTDDLMKLLPCPFCGGKAHRHTVENDDDHANANGDFIDCEKCLVSSRVFFGEKEGLEASWNLRTQPPQDGWLPVEKMPKNIKKGYMRIYSYAPEIFKGREYCNLSRAFKFESNLGHRILDMYMDIPTPPQPAKTEGEGL